MNKSELDSKHLAELHELAAEAGIDRYRMLSRAELIAKLAGGGGGGGPKSQGERRGGDSGRGRQRDRGRKPRDGRDGRGGRKPRGEQKGERQQKGDREQKGEREPRPAPAEPPAPASAPPSSPSGERPKRKRRRRRWGRRRKGVRVHDLLLPVSSGRQAIVYADGRAACTALLREVAAELTEADDGIDPIAVLVDPTPEELAEWKREAPKAEIVSAGKAKHAEDAIAQARSRASGGDDVIVLIDSLTRFAETFAGADEARELFDAAIGAGGSGSLTVVAAVERQS